MLLTPALLRRGLLAASLMLTAPVVFAQSTATKTAAKPAAPAADAKGGVLVGGAMMIPSRDIVDNAVLSRDHTTLVAAVKQAGLVETLKGKGPFTVFAPTNDAFAKLPAGTVDELLLPERKNNLVSILTYHVVPGALRAADLTNGQKLTTVQGQTLTVTKAGGRVTLKDTEGTTVNVTTADVISSNGVTHVVDGVLTPGM